MRQRRGEEAGCFGLEGKGNTVPVHWIVAGDDLLLYDSDKEDLIVYMVGKCKRISG